MNNNRDTYFWLCRIMDKDYGLDFEKMNEEGGFDGMIEEYFRGFIPPIVLDAIRSLQMSIVAGGDKNDG